MCSSIFCFIIWVYLLELYTLFPKSSTAVSNEQVGNSGVYEDRFSKIVACKEESLQELNQDTSAYDLSTTSSTKVTLKVNKGQDPLSSVDAYCDFYGIKIKNEEVIREVASMIKERKQERVRGYLSYEISANDAVKVVSPRREERDVPESIKSDIIWTNNPITPWNHVGLYTASARITEALEEGVRTRRTGLQEEYAFEVYKVTK